MVFDANFNLLEVDDGGIARLRNPNTMPNVAGTTGRRWESLTPGNAAATAAANQSLGISELYSVAVNTRLPGGPRLFTGAQDNGTSFQLLSGADDWLNVAGGDGALVAIDNSGAAPIHYWSRERFQAFTQWTDLDLDGTFAGDPAELVALNVVDANAPGTPVLARADLGLPFITQWALNFAAPSQIVIGGLGLWEIANVNQVAAAGGIRLVNAQGIVAPLAGATFTAMIYGGVNPANAATNPGAANANVLYAARGNQLFIRSAAGVAPTAHVMPFTGTVVDISLDPTNWTTAYVVVDRGGTNTDEVYRVTPNTTGGLNWDLISGNLFDTHLNTILAVRAGADIVVLVGGRTGVSRVINPQTNAAIWTEYGVGLPNTIVSDIHLSTAGLYIATFGRGIWSIPTATFLATINQAPVLRITGTNANDSWLLTRNATQPWLLDIVENGVSLGPFQLSTLQRIEVIGGGGDDSLSINIDNGPINVPEKIHFDGGSQSSTDNLSVIGTVNPLENRFNLSTRTSTIEARDFTGSKVTQRITWNEVENPFNSVPNVSRIGSVSNGLRHSGQFSTGMFARLFPVFGSSLARWANGILIPGVEGIALPPAGAEVPRARKPAASSGAPFLLRLFEAGEGAFNLDSVDSNGEINTLEELRTALDGLDSTPGNVTLSEAGGVTTFIIQIFKTLDGPANLEILSEVLGGFVNLKGTLDIAADVTLNLTVGADSSGFFIRPNAGTTPEISVRNIRIVGDVEAAGQLGFLGVTVTGATLNVDPAVRINIKLRDPGTEAADGMIRIGELQGPTESIATMTLIGNPAGSDITLTASVEVAALRTGTEPLFSLGNAQIILTWADVALPEQVTLQLSAGPSGDLLGFLQRSADGFLDGLSSVASDLQQMTGLGLFAVKIPAINKTLGEIMADVADPLLIPNSSVSRISSGFADFLNQKFVVSLNGIDLVKLGVGVGDAVFYRSAASSEVQGTVAAMDAHSFTVAFAAGSINSPTPRILRSALSVPARFKARSRRSLTGSAIV